MMNRIEATYYKDNDSINITEEGKELISLLGKDSRSVTSRRFRSTSNHLFSVITNNSNSEERLVASSIIWKTMLSKQSQIDAQLDKIDTALGQILYFIKSKSSNTPLDNPPCSETSSQK